MHELGITQEVVAIVASHAEGRTVSRVVLEIGELTAILPDAVEFCFDLCTEGTVAEGAKLEIVAIPGRMRCQECGTEFTIETFLDPCPCGSHNNELLTGQELRVKEMELV